MISNMMGTTELLNTWGFYYKLPLDDNIKLYHAILLTEREQNAARATLVVHVANMLPTQQSRPNLADRAMS